MPEVPTGTVIRDYVTAVGLALAGLWAFWRWTYGEVLRRKREMASPDGQLNVADVEIGAGISAVTLNALWRNRGALPIELCAEHTGVEVFEIIGMAPGVLDFRDEARSRAAWKNEAWWKTYIIEPNTESLMQDHFILSQGVVYAFKCTLCLAPGSLPSGESDSHFVCVRDLIWRSPQSARPGEEGLRISPVLHETGEGASSPNAVKLSGSTPGASPA